MIIEGEDGFDLLGIPPNALRGVLLTLLTGYRIPILRTSSVSETAVSLAHIARQQQKRVERNARANRQKRSAARTSLEILGTIPGVGDEQVKRLIEGMGSLKDVITASEVELRGVSGVGPGPQRRSAVPSTVRGTAKAGPHEGHPTAPA